MSSILGIVVGAIIKGVIGMMFKSKEEGDPTAKKKSSKDDYLTTTQVSEETYPHVQDPNYWVMAQPIMAALLKNAQLKSGAGMPGGVGAMSGMEDWTSSILEYLRQNLDTTLGVLGPQAPAKPTARVNPKYGEGMFV